MDLGLYLQVARRHRRLVIAGLTVTFALAVFSYVRISPSGIGYRSSPTWSNSAMLQLSQLGYPEYRSAGPGGQAPNVAALSNLTDLYAKLATSDAVLSILVRKGLLGQADQAGGTLPITAFPIPSTVNSYTPTPLISLTASGESPTEATKLAIGATDAFIAVLTASQKAAKIPPRQRIEVRVLKRPREPTIVAPRSKVPPIMVLLAGLTITFAAVFIRDNLQRKRSEAPEQSEPELVEVKLPERVRQPTRAPADTKTPPSAGENDVAASSPPRWSAQSGR
jgi:capsular polysaccharide biosynthesis protein